MNLIDELEREKAHSDGMKAAAQMWMQKAQEAQRTIFLLVQAAGGRIDVPLTSVDDHHELELLRFEDPANYAVTFLTRRLTATPDTA